MLSSHVYWRCPNCGLPLFSNHTGYSCENGHSFDRAKQGYCNFLLANQKNSKEPGDDMAMIDSRRRFLQEGHYTPLLNKIIEALIQVLHARNKGSLKLFDMGCGEGFYLNRIQTALAERWPEVNAFGVDISKFANRRAASLYKNAEFAVASVFNLPVVDHQADILLNIFSPFDSEEALRVIAAQGVLVRVSPGPRHLFELKEKLYETVTLHEPPKLPEGFQLVSSHDVQFKLELDASGSLQSLLGMTPLNYHGNSQAKAELSLAGAFAVSADFIVQICEPL